MIYLSGKIGSMRHPRLGFLKTPHMGNVIPPGVVWAADSGRYSSPQLYSDEAYLRWLARHPVERALFATAPDVLADHAATVALSAPMFPQLRRLGYHPAFVAQDGWTEDGTPWDDFDWLFIGGTNTFKLGRGGEAIRVALARGKQVHMGRVNSYKRLRLAAAMGCSSADGTMIAFGPDRRTAEVLGWLNKLITQPLLELA